MKLVSKYILCVAVMCLPFINGKAQDNTQLSESCILTDKTYLSNGGTNLFLARESISFQTGFHFKATGNGTVSARLDESLYKSQDYYPYITDDVDENPQNRQLDTLLEVGTIPGDVHVNSSGIGFYTIPIDLPDAPSGLKPELSIVYSSGGGNGVLGHNFNLSGISKIALASKNHFYDNEYRAISSGNATYTLDGARLISDAGEFFYTEKKEVGLVIQKKTTPTVYFEVKNVRDSLIYEYGRDNHSHNGMFWSVSKVKDQFGNTIEYFYKEPYPAYGPDQAYLDKVKRTKDECVLDKIVYGGDNEIRFIYSLRDDDFHFKYDNGNYQSGSSVLLDKIVIQKTSGEVYATYEFKYMVNSMGLSCLLEIGKKNGKGEALNPTLFCWDEPKGFQQKQKTLKTSIPEFNKATDFVGDFNNDGISDILRKAGNGNYELYVFNANGEVDRVKTVSTKSSDGTASYELLCVGNYSGTGKTEILGYREKEKECRILRLNEGMTGLLDNVKEGKLINIVKKPNKVVLDLDMNGKSEFIVSTTEWVVLYEFGKERTDTLVLDTENGVLRMALGRHFLNTVKSIFTDDFNGDGYTDCLINGCIYGYYNALKSSYHWEVDYADDKSEINFVDVLGVFDTDNDGLPNLLKHEPVECENHIGIQDVNRDGDYDDRYTIEYTRHVKYRTSEYSDEKTIISDEYELVSYEPYDYSNPNFIPFMNDDGDLVSCSDPSGLGEQEWEVWCTYRREISEYSIEYATCGETFKGFGKMDITRSMQVDVNGDGVSEYLVYTEDYQTPYLVRCEPKSGLEPIIERVAHENAIAGDFNGDGATDFIWEDMLYYTPDPQTTSVWNVIDGNNHQTVFSYDRIFDRHNWNEENQEHLDYPYVTMPGPYQVVSSVTKRIGGDTYTTDYAYSDSRFHVTGKGFLGFDNFTQTTEFSEIVSTIENYSQETGVPLRMSETVSNLYMDNNVPKKEPISRTITDVKLSDVKPGRCYTVSNKTVRATDENGNTTKTGWEFDTINGLLETVSVKKYVQEEEPITTEITEYRDWTADRFMRPQTIETKYSRTNIANPISQSVSQTYTPDGLLATATDKGLKTTYEYDEKGNVRAVTLSSVQTNDGFVKRTDRYEYDSSKLYPVKHTNALGQATSTKYDTWGNVLEETDVRGKTTSHTYNAWGRLLSTRTPEGIEYTYKQEYADKAAPAGSHYYTVVYKDGALQEKVYYDHLGRDIRRVSVSLGKQLYTDSEYDKRGNLIARSEPYAAGGQADLFTRYEYKDRKGRLTKEITPHLVKETSYPVIANTVRTTIKPKDASETSFQEEFFEKEYDASGFLIRAKDAGGEITYMPTQDNQVAEIHAPGGQVTKIEYDESRRRKALTDADAGTTQYDYYVDGSVKNVTNGNGHTTIYTYDALGRIKTEECKGVTYTYVYDKGKNAQGLLCAVESDTLRAKSEEYQYDSGGFGRLMSKTRKDLTKTLTTRYTYDDKGRLQSTAYPGGYTVSYAYNAYDDVVSISDSERVIWSLGAVNRLGQPESVKYGNGISTYYQYDSSHRLAGIRAGNVIDFSYGFNDKQQLGYRNEQFGDGNGWVGFREDFSYDNLNRLVGASGAADPLEMVYMSNAPKIFSKSGIGRDFDYNYGSTESNNKLSGFTADAAYRPSNHILTYTHRLKLESIRVDGSDSCSLHIDYGVDDQRFRQVCRLGGDSTVTWYGDDYEESVLPDGTVRRLSYVYAGGVPVAIAVQGDDSRLNGLHYVYTDYLGSIRCITDAGGAVEHRLGYDAWGRRRDAYTGALLPLDSVPEGLFTARGYTGHEHLDAFGYINMNGRVYDPALSMFLSPDPYIQAPDFTQNFNRYSYCLNNPFMYTDPSGEFVFSLFLGPVGAVLDAACWGAVIGGAGYAANVAFSEGGFDNWNWKQFGKSVGLGALSGAVTFGIGEVFGAVGSAGIGGEILRGYMHGFANGMISDIGGGSFMQGFVSGGLSSLAGSAFMMYGGDFANSAIGTYAFSGLAGGVGAKLTGGDFWQGTAIGVMNAGLNHLQQGIINKMTLVFDGDELYIVNTEEGRIVYRTNATSGKGEHMNVGSSQNIENRGPIPSGKYSFENNRWQKQSKMRQLYNIVAGNGDWGDYNVPLNVIYNANNSRHSFYLHGGFFKGSAGCIDAGRNIRQIYNFTKNQKTTYLYVRY